MMRAAMLPLPRRRRHVVLLATWSIALTMASIVWAQAIHSLANPKPVPVRVRPEAFVWGDRVFHDRTHLERWLRARGLSYESWARKHPAALRIMYPRRHASTPSSTATQDAKPSSRSSRVGKTAVQRVRAGTRGGGAWIAVYLLPLLALLASAAITAHARWRRAATRLLPSRPYLVAAAASVAIGLLIGHSP